LTNYKHHSLGAKPQGLRGTIGNSKKSSKQLVSGFVGATNNQNSQVSAADLQITCVAQMKFPENFKIKRFNEKVQTMIIKKIGI